MVCLRQRQNFFEMPRKVAAARAVLRREHADAAAVPDEVDRVEEIDDVEAHGHRLRIIGKQKLAGDADIELGVGRHGADIGVAVAQPAAGDHVAGNSDSAPRAPWRRHGSRRPREDLVRTRRPAAELVGKAGRTGPNLRVVGEDPMGLQVLEFSQAAEVGERRGIVEQELVGDGIDRFLPRQGQIGVGLKAVLLVLWRKARRRHSHLGHS